MPQTSKADSVAADTLAVKVETAKASTKSGDIDTTVFYEAKVIFNDLAERKSYLIGDAVVRYKDMSLKAAQITLDWDARLIIAEPLPDTVWVKSDPAGQDSVRQVKWVGEPVLSEGGTQMVGAKMIYNYRTEKGRVIKGRSDVEGGKYVGQQIKRVDPKTFNISNSRYTTCDLDSAPHFRFEARRMKMIPNDKVIAKPVVLRLGEIPVFALPFIIFPNKKGRHSGVLIPHFGYSYQEGRYLRDIGYYWAPNDYFDAKGSVDFFERSGFLFRGGANYSVRYLLNGTISGSFTRKNFETGVKMRRWDLNIDHSQELSPSARFTAQGNFVSDKNFYKNFSTDLDTRLNRELRSNATLTKNWSKQKLSLSVNVSQSYDIQDDVQTVVFPQVSFRKGQSEIFKPKRRGGPSRWYESLYYSYNSTLLNQEREYLSFVDRQVETTDAFGNPLTTMVRDTVKQTEVTRRVSHNLSLSLNSPKKFFGWLLLNHSLNYREDWFNETFSYSYDEETQKIISEKEPGFAARRTFTYNASANTKVYGVFPVTIGDISSFRHVITPALTFSYAPDFSRPEWGYFQVIEKPDGTTVKKDRFGFGTPSYGSGVISLSVRNLFQMKKGEGKKEQKIDLFNLDFNTGYNMRAEKNKLSDLRTSLTANPMQNLSVSADMSHSFYRFVNSGSRLGTLTDDYLWENDGWKHLAFARMTDFRLNFRLRLQGKGEGGGRLQEREMPRTYGERRLSEMGEQELGVMEEEIYRSEVKSELDRVRRSLSIPWRMNLNFNFNLNRFNPARPQKRYYLDVSGLEMNLSRNWRIGYSAHYDLAKREISHHRFSFYRDLHCWEAIIDWVPTGPGRRIYARLSIKSPMFKDIKVEKRGGMRSVLGY
ncbi:MAG: putative LPS assembly protein LptD [candidate division KSB1 bacterium]|nr:putative LPS assembly protein LptD [candidate division KSB1 bacterium]